MDDETCRVCKAYLAHYPVMADDWECEHDENEVAFMQAIADAVHATPDGEFIDRDWRAAQFLDDADLAWSCGVPPYSMRLEYNVGDFSFMAVVNEQHLLGARSEEGAELEHLADIGWALVRSSPDSSTTTKGEPTNG